MSQVTQSIGKLIDELAKLPGIGRKSAERLAYHLLRVNKAEAIRDVRENVHYCRECYNLAEGELCPVCSDARRDRQQLCVVEQPRDLMALEQAGVYRGVYHVLLGRIAPLDGIGPDQLTINRLVERVRAGGISEIIMATNPTVEGNGTALHISNLLAEYPISITRLARGPPPRRLIQNTHKKNF